MLGVCRCSSCKERGKRRLQATPLQLLQLLPCPLCLQLSSELTTSEPPPAGLPGDGRGASRPGRPYHAVR